MSLAAECIADLDSALREAGNSVVLRRMVGLPPGQTFISVEMLATVRGPNADELAGGFAQTDFVMITSPTMIAEAQWPGGQPMSAITPELPRAGEGGDKAIILGRPRQIEAVNPIMVESQVVRYEIKLKG